VRKQAALAREMFLSRGMVEPARCGDDAAGLWRHRVLDALKVGLR
jgi:hypothetical protein